MFFIFYVKKIIEHVDKQTVETLDQRPCYVTSDLGLRCLPVSQKMKKML